MIDSLSDLQWASPDEIRFREFVYSLLNRCSRLGISVMMTYEVSQLYGANQVSEIGASHLSDNVVMLQFISEGSQLRRSITVLKTRASAHQPEIREFQITREGIVLGEPVSSGEKI